YCDKFVSCFFHLVVFFFFFFFSSRRRHTRFSRDWSSDVCSSDLHELDAVFNNGNDQRWHYAFASLSLLHQPHQWGRERGGTILRSEERRVGKECRSRWSPDQ